MPRIVPPVVHGVGVVCSGAMAVVSRVLDSPEDREERMHRRELNWLWRQSQGRRR